MTTEAKIDQVVELVMARIDTTEADVREFINYDWPEGEEHTKWLGEATVEEIADWVITGIQAAR